MTEAPPTPASPEQIAALEAYLRELAGRIGLADWRIVVMPEPAEDDEEEFEVFLTVAMTEGCSAFIRAHPRFWARPQEEQGRICVHELGHLVPYRYNEILEQVKAVVPSAAAKVFDKAFEQASEYVAEWIALRLAPSMPLPPRFG